MLRKRPKRTEKTVEAKRTYREKIKNKLDILTEISNHQTHTGYNKKRHYQKSELSEIYSTMMAKRKNKVEELREKGKKTNDGK